MSTKARSLENKSISSWLAELRMECYKKNLDDFDTIRVSSLVCPTGVCNLPSSVARLVVIASCSLQAASYACGERACWYEGI